MAEVTIDEEQPQLRLRGARWQVAQACLAGGAPSVSAAGAADPKVDWQSVRQHLLPRSASVLARGEPAP
eukprot:8184582-Alexandrium_andersonii.AAC.1